MTQPAASPSLAVASLARQITEQATRWTNALRVLEDIIRENPAFARQLHAALEASLDVRAADATVRRLGHDRARVSPTCDRIRAFFKQNGNEPTRVDDIAKHTGLTEEAIRQVLYRRNGGEFERIKSATGRSVSFRLSGNRSATAT